MTTAARPTFEPAKGGMGRGERDLSALSKQYSARDLPSHQKLKYREHGQNTADEIRSRDFRRELEDRERETRDKDKRRTGTSSSSSIARESSSSTSSSTKKPRLDQIAPSNLDADDPQDEDDDDADDSDDDSDDEAVLFAELERIRRERAEEEAKAASARQEQEERIRMENIISGNPLLNLAAITKQDMKVKRRWDDDVVFKNCAASEPDKNEKKFINDSLRSEFHNRFMEKYIK